ncbi:MAG: DUF2249 domain-containing protein [Actinomycetales bacterium]|nr:DUF2249 domain-containing protein [Actinomycetales bacterium]
MADTTASLPLPIVSGGCSCGDAGAHADPVLDARTIPHEIRHAAIFGALDSLAPGAALVLVAPHNPLPLLAQARARYADGITIEYLQEGPDAWHLRLSR